MFHIFLFFKRKKKEKSFYYFTKMYNFSLFSPASSTQDQKRRNGRLESSRADQESRESTYLLLPAHCCLTVCRILSFRPAGYSCSCPLPLQYHASVNKDKKCGKEHSTSFDVVLRKAAEKPKENLWQQLPKKLTYLNLLHSPIKSLYRLHTYKEHDLSLTFLKKTIKWESAL